MPKHDKSCQYADNHCIFKNKHLFSLKFLIIKEICIMQNLFFYQEIDKETLDCFEGFLIQISLLCDKHKDKVLNEWLDAQDVCGILNIRPRTLQTYRNKGKIGFSQIDRKIYYKPCDVKKVLDSNSFNSKNKKSCQN